MNTPAQLHVRGSATREVAPDYASISVNVTARSPQRREAVEQATALLAELREATSADDVRSARMSGVHIGEDHRWNPETNAHERQGWVASVHGAVEVDSSLVTDVVARLAQTGAEVGYLEWRLERDNAAYREVRAEAVADAFRAAEDFAAALGRPLGELRILADPGLLGQGADPRVAPMAARAMAGDASGAAPELDPQPQLVAASVEATFDLG